MRRSLASLLTVAFSFPLIVPLLSRDANPDLPACCRRDGKHHCAMMDMAIADQIGSPDEPKAKPFQPKCPLYPKGRPATASAKALPVAVLVDFGALPQVQIVKKALTVHPNLSTFCETQQRGPPALS